MQPSFLQTVRRITVIAFCVFLGSSIRAQAAELTLSSEQSSLGGTFVISVHVSTKESLNAIDGGVRFDPKYLQVLDVSTGGSVFTLWPRTPVFSNETGAVLFTGGSARGYTGSGEVLKVIVKAKREGLTDISFTEGTQGYLADGRGTVLSLSLGSRKILIGPQLAEQVTDSWKKELAMDTTNPKRFAVQLEKNDALFEGRYFLSFSPIDTESGIDRITIKEGVRDEVIAESPYVLLDQTLRSPVTITAVDNAGNETSVRYYPYIERAKGVIIAIILGLIALAHLLARKSYAR